MKTKPILVAPENIQLQVKELLTFKVKEYNDKITTIKAYEEEGTNLRIPRNFGQYYPDYNRYIRQLDSGISTLGESIPEVTPNFGLRNYQGPIVDWAYEAAINVGGAIIHAECGAGKTVMLLNVAAMLGRVTLILVDREVLFDQWIEEISECLKVPTDKIGRVGKGYNEWRGKWFILATVQTLVRNKFERELLQTVGTLVCDEVHLFAAPTFDFVVNLFPAAYRLGGTATPGRSDGLAPLYFFNIGLLSKKAVVPPEYKVKPTIYIKQTKRQYQTPRITWNGKPDIVSMITEVANDEERNWLILEDIIKSLDANRHNLILCDRVEQRSWFVDKLDKAGYQVGIIESGMKTLTRKLEFNKQVVVATHHIAKYGLNIPTLECIFDIGVYSDPTRAEQSGGRSMRKVDKKDPLVVCYSDSNSLLRAMIAKRINIYKTLGWTVKDIL